MIPRIAVVLTCFNRRSQTLSCLATVHAQVGAGVEFSLSIVVADASSPDGTALAIREAHPTVQVLDAPPDEYWGGGMRRAISATTHLRPDFVLWLNDDVTLQPDAVRRLLQTASRGAAIVVGQLVDSSDRPSYGGFLRAGRTLRFDPVGTVDSDTPCDSFNGNVVLVNAAALALLGPPDRRFPHAMGDIDYGLRAKRQSLRVVQTPGTVGICDRNPVSPKPTSARARLRAVMSVKQLPPRAWWTFCARHAPLLAIPYFVKPYLTALLPAPAPRTTERVLS